MPVFHQPANSVGNHNYNVFLYDSVDYDLHFHKNYEIIYVVSGNAECSVNGKKKMLSEGEFAFCLSNEIHSIYQGWSYSRVCKYYFIVRIDCIFIGQRNITIFCFNDI